MRFELTAYTSEHIKRWLEIDNNSIMTILESEGNPLQKAISEDFTPINYSEERITLSQQNKLALLKGLEWDLVRVESNVREHAGHNWNQRMQDYRDLYLRFYPDINSIRQIDI